MKYLNKTGSQENKSLSRRKFIGTVGAASVAFTIVPRNCLGGIGYRAPSDMLNVAGIGVGGMGAGDVQSVCTPDIPVTRPIGYPPTNRLPMPYTPEQLANYLADRPINPVTPAPAAAPAAAPAKQPPKREPRKLANIYALCDVDSNYASGMFKSYPKAKVYSDWRKMLENEKSIDAVIIATPDHNHAPIAAAFIREKKHVYVEKPMCKTIVEARTLTQLAKEYNVVTQMGNQGHASEGTRQTVEWIQSGVIGSVREVILWTDRPTGWWPQGNFPRPEALSVPNNLNYDVWLGPAPQKPYNPTMLHFQWRGLWDYGTGAMGDMGAHIWDAPMWALDLGMPTKIQATSSPFSTEYLPEVEMVTYEFAARGNMPPVKITWIDGGLKAPRPSVLEPGRAIQAAVYYGDKGIMMHGSHGAAPQLVPADPNFKGVDPWLPRTKSIHEDWIDAILTGKKSCNDFSWASKVVEVMLLANIALKAKSPNITLEYDAANMKITNLPEANNLFHYEYRKGWSL